MIAAYLMQLPSPPRRNVFREWAGGMGTSLASERTVAGHDQGYYDIPFSALLYVARVLEQERVAYRYLDGQARTAFDEAGFLAQLAADRPAVLATVVNIPSLGPDLALLARARAALPGLRVLLLGPTAKWFKERLLREGHADFVMEEGEELLTGRNIARLAAGEALAALEGGSAWDGAALRQQPARAPMTSLDFVDFPAYGLLDFGRYESDYYFGERMRYATVFTTKGCPYRCGYCPYPFGFGNRLIYRNPKKVGEDIERLHREFGVGQILFRDQVFTVNRRHAAAVCEELIRRDLPIRWVCETRYDVVDEAMLDLMHRAGCREIHYGLESGDPAMFGAVAKSDGPQSLDLFEKVVGWTKARGMRCHTHLIVGMPDESWETVRNTGRWLRKVKPDSIQLAYFMPYPGTPIYQELKASQALGDPDAIDWEDFGSFTRPVMPTKHLTIEEVQRAKELLSWDLRYSLMERLGMRVRRMLRLREAA
ncbi:B12-binding domain-containing radical SAM protein [Paracraurococcus lichenis]|uniref:Radical SAM protein n=1 Tax=Paracraurococcus lichenis TaxID=3064888 RepID=A0ABT9E6G4_9PROT|nr:radical SAM protein [Paracraurococcus sp. LOR1-02]MDO9711736.1 radical SAM protein [Paracraurococcus sp. LOR1-02]